MSNEFFNINQIIETTLICKIASLFQSDGKYAHAYQCDKSSALTKVIDLIIEIESFEQKCVIIKVFFQSDRL